MINNNAPPQSILHGSVLFRKKNLETALLGVGRGYIQACYASTPITNTKTFCILICSSPLALLEVFGL